MRGFERVAIAVAALALSVGLIALLTGFFTRRDRPAIAGPGPPGRAFPDLGNGVLRPGQLHRSYDSRPPTSGSHLPKPVTSDEVRLSDDQLLEALSLGDVVVAYGARHPPPALVALARAVGGPFTAALAAAGQAVVLDRLPGISGVVGLAWAHVIRVARPGDPRLRAFLAYWLGRGAPPSPSVSSSAAP